MSKVLNATCEFGLIKVESQIVDGEILSEGIGKSSGIVVIDKENLTYITSNATDLKETIVKLNDIVMKITEILTAIGSGMTGPTTAPPPTLATGVIEVTTMLVELNLLSEKLK